MSQSRGPLRSLFSLLLLGATALGLYNVYADNADVRALAERTACGARDCSTKVTREARSPLGQSFTFQTRLVQRGKSQESATADVECRRQYYLLGEYQCTTPTAATP